jgi:hypothetical protein
VIDGPTAEIGCKYLTLQLDDFLVEATKSFSRIFQLEAAKTGKYRMFRECRARQCAPKDASSISACSVLSRAMRVSRSAW